MLLTLSWALPLAGAILLLLVPNRDGSRTTPSIVAFTPDNDRLVGQIAKRQAITNPTQTVYAVKRLIGRKFDDPNVQRARDVLPYALADAPNGDVKIQIRDRQHSPEEISAFVLRELKSFSEEVPGEPQVRFGPEQIDQSLHSGAGRDLGRRRRITVHSRNDRYPTAAIGFDPLYRAPQPVDAAKRDGIDPSAQSGVDGPLETGRDVQTRNQRPDGTIGGLDLAPGVQVEPTGQRRLHCVHPGLGSGQGQSGLGQGLL